MKGQSLDLRKTEMSVGSRAKNQAELGQRMNSMEHGASFQLMGNTFFLNNLQKIIIFHLKKIINIEVKLQDEIRI